MTYVPSKMTKMLLDTRITSAKHILFILAVKFTWATCFYLI